MIESRPLIHNAIFFQEEGQADVPMIPCLTRALRAIGCRWAGDVEHRYSHEGKVVAAAREWYDTPDGEWAEDWGYSELRLDIDKDFVRKYRAQLIEHALPWYAHEVIVERCRCSGAPIDEVSKEHHDRINRQCLKDLEKFFDSAE